MKRFTIIWTIVLVLTVTALTIFGFSIKKEHINSFMEEGLVEQAEKYLGLYPGAFPTLGKESRLSYDFLKDAGYDAKLESGCDGYVIVTNTNSGFKYKGYVDCPSYTTEGYYKE